MYTSLVKNITFSADEELIYQARLQAQLERRSLNDAFREWLSQYVARQQRAANFRKFMEEHEHIHLGGPYTRDEMNERR